MGEDQVIRVSGDRVVRVTGDWLLRYLSIIGLCFWLGGFTFYAGVVIHVGHRVFDSPREIGFLTQAVTLWLNRSGVIVLLILLANQFRSARVASRWVRNAQFSTLLLMAAIQVALFLMHPKLDVLLDVSKH